MISCSSLGGLWALDFRRKACLQNSNATVDEAQAYAGGDVESRRGL